MDTKDIDEYLSKIKSSQGTDEQIRATNELLIKLNEWFLREKSYGRTAVLKRDNGTKLVQYLFDSGAYDKMLEIGFNTIPDLCKKMKIFVKHADFLRCKD